MAVFKPFCAFRPVQDKAKSMAWGNIIFGGIIGIAVDRSTGAGCQYPQQNIYYPMKKASQ